MELYEEQSGRVKGQGDEATKKSGKHSTNSHEQASPDSRGTDGKGVRRPGYEDKGVRQASRPLFSMWTLTLPKV